MGETSSAAGPASLADALFDRVSDRAYALDGAFRFVAVNAACARHFGRTPQDLVGRTIWDALPSYEGTPDEAVLRRVAAGGGAERFLSPSHVLPGLTLDVQVFPLGGGVGVVFRDVTDADAAVAAREAAAQALRESRAAAWTRLAELQAIYDTAPVGLCVIDRDRRFRRVNRRLAEINGVPAEAHVGRTVAEVVPAVADAAEPLFRRIFETGEPQIGIEIVGETPASPGTRRVWLEDWIPLRGEDGAISAVNVVAVEITERKAAEERERLLVRELDHRTKNILAVVQALVRLGARTEMSPEADGFARAVEGRVAALARAHARLAAGRWEGLDVGELLRGELAPHAEGDRARAEGPPLRLSPDGAQAIAMVAHELATNAAKYGALARPDGRLDVCWAREGDEVVIRWREADGPPVVQPASAGFGTQLVRTTVEAQMGGRFAPDWHPDGFSCTIRLPAAAVLGG
jgi:two-component system CheB/CheR fusion protein